MDMALTVPRYTVAELDDFPDDGNRYELLDGVLMVTPSPGSPHQGIAARLAITLGVALQIPGHAYIYTPGVVQLPPRTQLQPDLLVAPARLPIGAPWVDMKDQWLAVEVLSPSSRRYDRDFKRNAYLDLGVREVWLVDIRDRSVEVCQRRGEGDVVRDVIHWHIAEITQTVDVDLRELFAGLD